MAVFSPRSAQNTSSSGSHSSIQRFPLRAVCPEPVIAAVLPFVGGPPPTGGRRNLVQGDRRDGGFPPCADR
ncbi:hypothetical protein GCM10009802_10540 [Streptomyces synnematoformans]|uniref:Uncharacterized protein n=1 Tax=Streptomyces synnematoformans TaxID=415721 RepID=A0ABN2XHN2_9ACTN